MNALKIECALLLQVAVLVLLRSNPELGPSCFSSQGFPEFFSMFRAAKFTQWNQLKLVSNCSVSLFMVELRSSHAYTG